MEKKLHSNNLIAKVLHFATMHESLDVLFFIPWRSVRRSFQINHSFRNRAIFNFWNLNCRNWQSSLDISLAKPRVWLHVTLFSFLQVSLSLADFKFSFDDIIWPADNTLLLSGIFFVKWAGCLELRKKYERITWHLWATSLCLSLGGLGAQWIICELKRQSKFLACFILSFERWANALKEVQ